jgi:hypothetical protein
MHACNRGFNFELREKNTQPHGAIDTLLHIKAMATSYVTVAWSYRMSSMECMWSSSPIRHAHGHCICFCLHRSSQRSKSMSNVDSSEPVRCCGNASLRVFLPSEVGPLPRTKSIHRSSQGSLCDPHFGEMLILLDDPFCSLRM